MSWWVCKRCDAKLTDEEILGREHEGRSADIKIPCDASKATEAFHKAAARLRRQRDAEVTAQIQRGLMTRHEAKKEFEWSQEDWEEYCKGKMKGKQ